MLPPPESSAKTHVVLRKKTTNYTWQQPKLGQGSLSGRLADPDALGCVQRPTIGTASAGAVRRPPARIVLGGFQPPFPPAVAHRLLLSSLTAAIE